MDPQISGPNWSLCRDIESFVTIESLVFVVGFCRNLQFFFVTYSLSFFLDSITIDFNNVAIGMSCVATQNLFAPSSLCTFASGNCRDIIFFIATSIFLFSLSTLSRQDSLIP